MSNDFYNAERKLTRLTLGRSEIMNAILAEIIAGFEKLPDEAPLKEGRVTYGTDRGTANTYVVTLPYPVTDYTEGLSVSFRAANTNTGASTVNVDGLGVKAVVTTNGDALAAGDVPAGGIITIRYDGMRFQYFPSILSNAVAARTAAETAVAAVESATVAADNASAAFAATAESASSALSAATDAASHAGRAEQLARQSDFYGLKRTDGGGLALEHGDGTYDTADYEQWLIAAPGLSFSLNANGNLEVAF